MKRAGNLWTTLTAWDNLTLALHRAALGKRSRPDVAHFLLDWESRILQLRRELLAAQYRPGPYREFQILDPKPRRISAAPFRDRVVHHALTQILEPLFEPRFTRHSFACRAGLGTHKALHAAAHAVRATPYVLKCDIRRYFPSIDHQILKSQLRRAVKCPQTLALAGLIIDSSNPQEEANCYFPGDTLFTPFERRRGLPLGNQTSQFFANVYLNGLDHFVLREIQPAAYIRYVDDFLLFHHDKQFLADARHRIELFLDTLRLRLHPGKSRVYRTQDGVTFLGWRLFPDRRRLVAGNVARFRRKLRKLKRDYALGLVSWEEIEASVQAWNAHADHGDTWKLREQLFDDFWFPLAGRKSNKIETQGKKIFGGSAANSNPPSPPLSPCSEQKPKKKRKKRKN